VKADILPAASQDVCLSGGTENPLPIETPRAPVVRSIAPLAILVSRMRPDGTKVELPMMINNAESMPDEILIEHFKAMLVAYRRDCSTHPSEIKSLELHHA